MSHHSPPISSQMASFYVRLINQFLYHNIHSNHWRWLPNEGSRCWWPCRHNADLGHSRPGAFPVVGRCILSWRRLLCSCVRRDRTEHLQEFGFMAWWVSDSSQSTWSRSFPVCCARQQSRFGESSGKFLCNIYLSTYFCSTTCHKSTLNCVQFLIGIGQTSTAMVPKQERDTVFWDLGKGGN